MQPKPSSAAASTEPLSAVAEALHYFGAHRPDSPRHAAWVALDKFLEGDPDVVLPSEPLAGSQAGSNGPSGSPTSPSGRDSAAANCEGWLGLVGSRKFHYIGADGRSLCGKWLSLDPNPEWGSGPWGQRVEGDCAPCARALAKRKEADHADA